MEEPEQPMKTSDHSFPDHRTNTAFKVIVESLTVFAPRKSSLSLIASRLSRQTQIYHSKALLRNVSLECEPGQLLAIIGASGSGKTTLLNTIAGRSSNLQVKEGEVKLMGSSDSLKGNVVAFVRQEDYLLPNLTVIETINFFASLKLPSALKRECRDKIVNTVLEELDLSDVRSSRVGTLSGNGISGGERRRLSIACALVTLPSVLILDEPTTGLDSYTASSVIKILSKLAHKGRSIIMSIHQPPSGAFELIDKICLMSYGKVMYYGLRTECLPWFSRLGHESVEHTNPFDFLIDLSSVDTRCENDEERTKLVNYSLLESWKNKCELDKNATSYLGLGKSNTFQCSSIRGQKQPTLRQFSILTQRALLNMARNRQQMLAYIIQTLFIGIFLGFTFYKPPETPAGVQTLKTLCYSQFFVYFFISFIFFAWIYSQELIVFDRERDDNLYAVGPYIFSQMVSYLPTNFIFPTFYSIVRLDYLLYVGVIIGSLDLPTEFRALGLLFNSDRGGFRKDNPGTHLGNLIAVNFLMQLSSQIYSFSALCINRNFARAFSFSNAFASTYLMTAGYLLISIPVYVKWLRWINPYYYSFNWLVRDQFEGRQFSCTGITGPLASQCQGHNVLEGLNLQLSTPLYVLPLGLMGYNLVIFGISYLLLRFYHPGGQKAAAVQERTAPLADPEEISSAIAKKVCVDVKLVSISLGVLTSSFDKSILRLRIKRTEKAVLKNINAIFKAGEISAILGPSGAGKSSLLRLLAGNIKSGPLTSFTAGGDIFLNNRIVKSNYYRKLISYCEQGDDWHMPALTVRETLKYAALLRLRHISKQERLSRAEELIRAMGLKTVADTLVGNELVKGISGGEKRRLSLAVALLDDPSVVILDEPTSGLDAYTATSVMNCLKQIAETGVTVICSIHSPRSEIWGTFDSVTLMGKGGRILFTGSREDCLESLTESGMPCPADWNPADHALNAIFLKLGVKEDRKDSVDGLGQMVQTWRSSVMSFQSDAGRELPRWESQSKLQEVYTTFSVLVSRSIKNIFRQRDVFITRVVNMILLGLIGWLFFLRLGHGAAGVQNRIGALQQNNAVIMTGMVSAMTVYPGERNIFLREYRSAAKQSPMLFIFAYTVVEIPMELICSIIYTIIYMYGYGLQHGTRRYFELAVANFCVLNTGESIGMFISTWIPNGGLSVALCSSIYGILGQISGIRSVTIPKWLQVIAWIAPVKPQTYIATINEFAGLDFNCSEADVNAGKCVAASGDEVLEAFGMHDRDTSKYLWILISLFIFYRLLAWASLQLKVSLL